MAKKTDPKTDPKPRFKVGEVVMLDGVPVNKIRSGSWSSTGRNAKPKSSSTSSTKKSTSKPPANPGATMRAIKGSSGSSKSKPKTNYKSYGSSQGKATPGRKRNKTTGR